ncbi:hypothetical protein M8D54_004957 [Salmonella enterica]|nr:hypothetical protein [Salmonella enterica]EHR7428484.1 hypothetical protein [Salmonella enterica]EJF2005540.1 hypothetical protein [Salmonella enterica]EJF2493112.1 hypothetical protein [Salmonella enterica]EJX7804520.1 hypothetical protein [Salmonella enterica]
MKFELWVDNEKILEPDFRMSAIKDHEDLIVIEVEGLSVEDKYLLFNSFKKDYELYLEKEVLDELNSYCYVGFSFADEDEVLNKGIIKFIKVDESDKLKQITRPRKRISYK